MKWILICGFVAAFGSAAFWADLLGDRPIRGDNETIGTVGTEGLAVDRETDPASLRVFASGFIEGASREAVLQFDLPGRLVRLHVTEGSRVDAGQVLAELDAAVWEQELGEAQAQLAQAVAERDRLRNAARPEARRAARASVAVLQVEVERLGVQLDRIRRIHARGAATEQELQEADHLHRHAIAQRELAEAQAAEITAPARVDELQVAEAKIAVARSRVQSAEARLAKTRLDAPTDGVVLSIDAEPGEIVGPESSRPVAIIADLSSFRVRAYVEELDAMRVSPGDTAEVIVDAREQLHLTGTVVSSSQIMKPKRHRTFRPDERLDVMTREVVIALHDAERDADSLVIGMPADVYINASGIISPATPPTPSTPSLPSTPQDEQHDGEFTAEFTATGVLWLGDLAPTNVPSLEQPANSSTTPGHWQSIGPGVVQREQK